AGRRGGRGGGGAGMRGATVREQAGRWWVSFQIEVDRTDIDNGRTVPADAPTCGIDLGLTTFATIVDDDGTVTELHAPKALAAAQRRLRRAQHAPRPRPRHPAQRPHAA